MATKIVLQSERASAVYDERWRSIYQAIGAMSIERATNVEFNNETGEWEAIHLATGHLIAHSPNRTEVIDCEVTWLENEWLGTTETTQEENQSCRTP